MKTFAICWVMMGTITIYLTSAHGQPKPTPKPAAKAEAKPAAPPEMPPKPTEETKKLSFLVGTFNGTGKLEKGAMGPDSAEMTSKSKQTCKWALGNLWVVCDISDTAGAGKTAMTWMGHMLIGYDLEAKQYRNVGADNMGTAYDLNARIEGNKLVMESAHDVMMMGMPVKFRFTYDFTDPKALKFTDERSMKGGPWQLAETTTFKKAG